MDPIQQMHEACEGMFISTNGSRKRYMRRVAKIEKQIDATLDKYEQLYKLSTELSEKAMQYDSGRKRDKYIRKNMKPITDFCLRNDILDMKPVEHLKEYKKILTRVFNRADRKNPDVKAACDEMMAKLNPGGELYEKAQEMQDRFDPEKLHGEIAKKGAQNANAAIQREIMIRQQELMQQQVQQQIQQNLTNQTMMMSMGMM